MTNEQCAVDISGLVKRFGSHAAVDGLDLRVGAGTVHGFLGPNGAGKSTTLRVLLGLYRFDEGSVQALGMNVATRSAEVNRRIGYVPGDVSLWPNLTGGQVLDAFAGLRGARDEQREKELIERFELDPTKKVHAYSKGNRQKVALVAACAAPVDLLVLDEPTSGLDPLMEWEFGVCVREAVAAGRTVLLSSHILSEVEQLCSEVTIIKDGRLVETGSLAQMRHLASSTVTVRGADDALVASLERAGGIAPQQTDGSVVVQVARNRLPAVLAVVATAGVQDVSCVPASLEDLFLRHYRTP
ncbi:ABC transporter ATP-binding protein [Calidifontibacter terrae]